MASANSLLDIFQTVNTTRKNLVESLYVDEACYNEEIDDKLDKEKFEGVYPYSYLEGDENNKSIIIFKDLIKNTNFVRPEDIHKYSYPLEFYAIRK